MKSSCQVDKIADAGARLFGAQRYHEVRMEDVAAEAGVAKGTLYRYCRDKEDLHLLALVRALEHLTERLRSAVARARGPRAGLEALAGAVLAHFDENPHLMGLIQRAELEQKPGTPLPWDQTRAEVLRLIIELFEEGRALGAFHVRDPELAGMMLLGGLRTVIRAGERPRPADLSRRIVDGQLWGAADPVPSGRVPAPAARHRPVLPTETDSAKTGK
jgi:AcrR family transcriptional regulator